MKWFLRRVFMLIEFVFGCFWFPATLLSFITMTNSSKGWNVCDPDGEMFIPLGIIGFIFLVGFFILECVKLIKFWNKKKLSQNLINVPFFLGIPFFFLLDWLEKTFWL